MSSTLLYLILVVFSGVSFVIYGVLLFNSSKMKADFERFKLKKYTYLVGSLEILGGLGLIIGLAAELLLTLSSFGLAALMLLGVVTRIKVKDDFILIIPALLFLFLNSFICYESLIK